MSRPGGNPTLCGNKNSGRKSTRVEFAKNEAVRKAWLKVNESVDSKEVEKIALPLALKDMIQKQEHSGEVKIGVSLYGGQSTKTIPGYTSDEENIPVEKED